MPGPSQLKNCTRTLVLNCGSASVKWALYEGSPPRRLKDGNDLVEVLDDYQDVLERIVADLPWTPDVVGHRVVHGGIRFHQPTLISTVVEEEIRRLARLAPLHNPPALEGIRVARTLGVPMVACFDTAFHQTLPERAWRYAIPMGSDPEVRRYGFHGLSHEFVTQRYLEITGRSSATLITVHLGGGSSMAAIKNGICVDTSMGMGPLEGLVMATRPGDLDPAVILHLLRSGKSVNDVERILNRESGLRALAGTDDMREILCRVDPEARLAVEIYCYRVRKYVGAYLAALGGAKAVVFTGGIGEHAVDIRRRSLEGLEWAGIEVDEARNLAGAERISSDNSRIQVFVIPTDEQLMIARQALLCIQ